jgi:hypothetical protein
MWATPNLSRAFSRKLHSSKKRQEITLSPKKRVANYLCCLLPKNMDLIKDHCQWKKFEVQKEKEKKEDGLGDLLENKKMDLAINSCMNAQVKKSCRKVTSHKSCREACCRSKYFFF